MSHHKKPSENLLEGIKYNKYIHPNAISKSMEHRDSDSSSPEIQQMLQSNDHHIVRPSSHNHNKKQAVYDIDYPFYINKIDGRDKTSRTRGSFIRCMMSRESVEASLLLILKNECIEEPI